MSVNAIENTNLYFMSFDDVSMRHARRLLAASGDRDISRLEDHAVLDLLRMKPAFLAACHPRFAALLEPQDDDKKKADSKLTKSGKSWVKWAEANARQSTSLADLDAGFRGAVRAFIEAMEEAGATARIIGTRRSARRAYLYCWAWQIAVGRCKPSAVKKRPDVGIEWDHGDDKESIKGAMEMVAGFGLELPPHRKAPPALNSNLINGKAIELDFRWKRGIWVKKKDGLRLMLKYMSNPRNNSALHKVGASYGCRKSKQETFYWSHNGA